jgi:hypothetical protein
MNKNKQTEPPLALKSHHLSALRELPGYLAASIITSTGEILACHIGSADLDETLFGVFVAGMLEDAHKVASSGVLGGVNYVLLDCCGGSLVTRWIDEQRHYLISTLIAPDGNPGMAKYKINSLVRRLQSLIKHVDTGASETTV